MSVDLPIWRAPVMSTTGRSARDRFTRCWRCRLSVVDILPSDGRFSKTFHTDFRHFQVCRALHRSRPVARWQMRGGGPATRNPAVLPRRSAGSEPAVWPDAPRHTSWICPLRPPVHPKGPMCYPRGESNSRRLFAAMFMDLVHLDQPARASPTPCQFQ